MYLWTEVSRVWTFQIKVKHKEKLSTTPISWRDLLLIMEAGTAPIVETTTYDDHVFSSGCSHAQRPDCHSGRLSSVPGAWLCESMGSSGRARIYVPQPGAARAPGRKKMALISRPSCEPLAIALPPKFFWKLKADPQEHFCLGGKKVQRRHCSVTLLYVIEAQ